MKTADETTDSWRNLIHNILHNGVEVTCRGNSCIELLSHTSTWDMRDPVIKLKARKIGYKFMQAEAMSIMNGDFRVSTLSQYSKTIASYSDNGLIFFGAYGPMIVSQLNHIFRTLIDDKYSRQAVLTIWKSNPPITKDVPCTVSMQFLIRNRRIDTIVYMRSSDAWLGIPYDIFTFSMVTWGILLTLKQLRADMFDDIQLGFLHLIAGSEHLYANNVKQAMTVLQNIECYENPVNLESIFACNTYDEVIAALSKGIHTCMTTV